MKSCLNLEKNKAEARQQMAMELQDLQDRADGQQESGGDQPASEAWYVDSDLQDSIAIGVSEGVVDLGEDDTEVDSQHGESSDGDDA